MAWGSPYVDYVDVLVWLRILHPDNTPKTHGASRRCMSKHKQGQE